VFFLLLFVFSALLQLFLPWWISGVICFSMALGWNQTRHRAFLEAGGSQAILWLLYAMFQDVNNDHILAPRMAELFSLPYGWMMPWLSALLVFITSGLAGYAGARVRDTFLTPPSSNSANGDFNQSGF
jgi:hypothetical protein